jgi:methionyl-tRNA formyltransferase
MNITILLSDKNHPIYPYILNWEQLNSNHSIEIVHSLEDVNNGDILFLISCSLIVKSIIRDKFERTFVIHASDLPKGRGWSPHIWSILDGESVLTVSLIEAMDKVDTGDIWAQKKVALEGHELLDEINTKLFEAELFLMTLAISDLNKLNPKKQKGDPGEYCLKRSPKDSEIDISKNIEDQFNLLRTVDSEKFPAFFIKNGIKYLLKITKDKN